MTDPCVYERTREVHELPATLRLRHREWSLYFSLDGERTAGEVRLQLGLNDTLAHQAINTLLEHDLIRERAVSLAEFTEACGRSADTDNNTPASLSAYLQARATPSTPHGVGRSAVHAPASDLEEALAAEPAPPLRPASVAAPVPSAMPSAMPSAGLQPLPVPNLHVVKSAAVPPPSVSAGTASSIIDEAPPRPKTFVPLQIPATQPRKAMSLQAVIQFILDHSPDKTAGQLAVYRVFMGIDTRLLKKAGIQSLRFQEDRLIQDTELQSAISQSVSKALRVALPATL